MKIYNKFLLFLAAGFGSANIMLAWLGQDDLAVYFIVNAIVYLLVALFHANLNMRAQTSVNRLGAIIFSGFFIVFVFKIFEIVQ